MELSPNLPLALLEILPNPVLVKDEKLRYVWVNPAFEALFDVRSEELVGQLDTEIFANRQAAQCNGGDLRVLASGELDEATETVVDFDGTARETITRKSRLEVDDAIYLVGVMHDITEVTRANEMLQSQSEALELLANADSLTGCLTRRALFTQWDEIDSSDLGHGVLMIDADNFKALNDTYGHDVGDNALVQIADILRNELTDDAIFARFGGEEFVVVLPRQTLDTAAAVGESLRSAVSDRVLSTPSGDVAVTVSVGVAHAHTTHRNDLDAALRQADSHLFEAKEQGRNLSIAA